MKVSVITPTTGNPLLTHCIKSVKNQTYKNVEHIVVVDGAKCYDKTHSILTSCEFPNGVNEYVCVLPYPTGTDRYNGHRIYGAATYFADGDYHIWLDEDNSLEPNHVESLVNLVTEKKLHWAYSFRQIVDNNQNFICYDDCESLGKWKSVIDDNFIDVGCFFVNKNIAIEISKLWYRKAREPGVMEVDRAISAVLMHEQNSLKFDTTGDYTLKYRVGSTGISVQADFFLRGNEEMLKRYNGVLPWKK